MFRLRFAIDCQARTKNGPPPQTTTGVARKSCVHAATRGDTRWRSGWPGSMSPITDASNGKVSTVLTQKRRVMSRSSGFTSSAALTVLGSSAMPHMGQAPGPGRTIWGCIGHVYSTRGADGAAGVSGSSAIPHFGTSPARFVEPPGASGT